MKNILQLVTAWYEQGPYMWSNARTIYTDAYVMFRWLRRVKFIREI